MSGIDKKNNKIGCAEVCGRLQDYLDETLDKSESMAVYLHLRDCEGCRKELDELKALFAMLGDMPQTEVPEDFDEKILASVPYAAYREMEPLRRERIPVLLEEESLPGFVRSAATRIAGGTIAVATAAGLALGRLPDPAAALLVLGVLPEALVLLQRFTRRLYVEATQDSANH